MNKVLIDIREESEQIKRIFKGQDTVTIEQLLSKIEDLDDDNEYLEDKIKDMEQDIEDNYKRIPYAEQVDISDAYFR